MNYTVYPDTADRIRVHNGDGTIEVVTRSGREYVVSAERRVDSPRTHSGGVYTNSVLGGTVTLADVFTQCYPLKALGLPVRDRHSKRVHQGATSKRSLTDTIRGNYGYNLVIADSELQVTARGTIRKSSWKPYINQKYANFLETSKSYYIYPLKDSRINENNCLHVVTTSRRPEYSRFWNDLKTIVLNLPLEITTITSWTHTGYWIGK